jgi:3',5'-cyclic AMP phosphodiesterase CpdA
MLIAQLSDPHVREPGALYQGVVDSNRMFAQALAHLDALDRRPDLLVLTGDLVDHGRPAEYQQVRRLLAATDIPWLAMAGNHDEREAFRAAFHDQACLPREGALHFCVDDHPVRIVAVDSCIPGLHHGRVDAAALAWLDATLAAEPAKPTVLMLHHPPFVSGIPYMDAYRCMEPEGLEAVVRAHAQVERVLCGHVHRSMLRRWAGTVACTAPSTTTEICLQLRPDAPPASVVGPAGCLLHLWDPVHGMVSHVSHIGQFEGPYSFA